MRWFLACFLLFHVAAFSAENMQGRVVLVHDGDSLVLEDEAGARHDVRLATIDAPELGQAYSARSKKNLASMVFGQRVRLIWHRRDAYGRLLGKLLFGQAGCQACPLDQDAGLKQLEAGMAWWYREFKHEQSLLDQGYYEYAEFDAKMKRLGLWSQPQPVPPWEWRKNKVRAMGSPLDGFADHLPSFEEAGGIDGMRGEHQISFALSNPQL